jgi:hypothetical protein
MNNEQRNNLINEILKKCVFIRSKSVKMTELDVQAIKECRDLANRWEEEALGLGLAPWEE